MLSGARLALACGRSGRRRPVRSATARDLSARRPGCRARLGEGAPARCCFAGRSRRVSGEAVSLTVPSVIEVVRSHRPSFPPRLEGETRAGLKMQMAPERPSGAPGPGPLPEPRPGAAGQLSEALLLCGPGPLPCKDHHGGGHPPDTGALLTPQKPPPPPRRTQLRVLPSLHLSLGTILESSLAQLSPVVWISEF